MNEVIDSKTLSGIAIPNFIKGAKNASIGAVLHDLIVAQKARTKSSKSSGCSASIHLMMVDVSVASRSTVLRGNAIVNLQFVRFGVNASYPVFPSRFHVFHNVGARVHL